MNKRVRTLALFISIGWLSTPCLAAGNLPDLGPQPTETNYPDAWHFKIGAYYWFSGNNGYFRIKDSLANINVPMAQVRQHLDFGGQGIFEFTRYDWSFIFNPSYTHFTVNGFVHDKRAKISQGTVTIDVGAYYLLLAQKCPLDDYYLATLELLGAGRIMTYHSTIHYYDNSPSKADGSGFMVPVLGARVKYQFNAKTQAWINADFGGFKMYSVNSTWSAMLGVAHRISKGVDVNLAYKALGVNYSKTAMTNNMLFYGPMLGLTYSW